MRTVFFYQKCGEQTGEDKKGDQLKLYYSPASLKNQGSDQGNDRVSTVEMCWKATQDIHFLGPSMESERVSQSDSLASGDAVIKIGTVEEVVGQKEA